MMGDAMLLRAPLLSLVLSLGKLHLLYGIPLIPVRESLVLLRGSSAWQHSGKNSNAPPEKDNFACLAEIKNLMTNC